MAVERRSHSAKNAITLGQCLLSHLFKAANYALPGCENMLPEQGRRGRNLHSPSILTQICLAAVLPSSQNLNVLRFVDLNTEILQLSLLLCIFYYFIHNTALFRVHDLLAFEQYSFHATLHAWQLNFCKGQFRWFQKLSQGRLVFNNPLTRRPICRCLFSRAEVIEKDLFVLHLLC